MKLEHGFITAFAVVAFVCCVAPRLVAGSPAYEACSNVHGCCDISLRGGSGGCTTSTGAQFYLDFSYSICKNRLPQLNVMTHGGNNSVELCLYQNSTQSAAGVYGNMVATPAAATKQSYFQVSALHGAPDHWSINVNAAMCIIAASSGCCELGGTLGEICIRPSSSCASSYEVVMPQGTTCIIHTKYAHWYALLRVQNATGWVDMFRFTQS